MSENSQNVGSPSIRDFQKLQIQMVRLEESLKTAVETTAQQFKSHHEKLDSNTRCNDELKRDLNFLKNQLASRISIDPQEEHANYQYVIELRKTKTFIKSALIKTVIPIILSLLAGSLLTYNFVPVERMIEEKIENKIEEKIK